MLEALGSSLVDYLQPKLPPHVALERCLVTRENISLGGLYASTY
jgi:hypothetical protein